MNARFPALAGLVFLAAGPALAAPPRPSLTGTAWRLLEFRSSDDAIGAIRPGPNETYTLTLESDGRVSTQLYCNRGMGRWTSPDAAKPNGEISIGPLATTRMACPPGRLDRLPADLGKVRSFMIRDGRLALDLPADVGQYVWTANVERRVVFRCDRGGPLTIVFSGETARVRDTRGGDFLLRQRPAASGFWYGTPQRAIRGKGRDLTYTVGRMVPIKCRAKEWPAGK